MTPSPDRPSLLRCRPSRGIALSLALVGASFALYEVQEAHGVHAQSTDGDATARTQRQRRPQRQRRFYRLFEAIANNRVAEVRRRLPSRAQINDLDRTSGSTPLTWSLIPTQPPTAERMEIIRMLLDGGADPNAPDNDGTSAVEAAVAYPWPEVLRLLVERGGDLRVPATVGQTTLLYAVCQGNGADWPGRLAQRLAVARILIEGGLDPTEMSPWAQSHNHTAVDKCVVYDMPDIARLYVEHGGRPQSTLTSRAPRRAALARELNALADARARARARAPSPSPGSTHQ